MHSLTIRRSHYRTLLESETWRLAPLETKGAHYYFQSSDKPGVVEPTHLPKMSVTFRGWNKNGQPYNQAGLGAKMPREKVDVLQSHLGISWWLTFTYLSDSQTSLLSSKSR